MSISVVIPCFNGARTLAETLETVGRQSRAPSEVLVVDDGSSDGSPAVARAAGAIVLATGGNRGPSAARNLGIEHATGDLIAFVDADDLWSIDHLAEVVGLLDRHPEAVLGFSRIEKFLDQEPGEPVRGPLWTSPAVGEGVPMDLLPELLGTNPVPQSTVVARRRDLVAAGGYHEAMRYSEDYDLWCRLALSSPFVASSRVTCRYRVHATQATARGPSSIARAAWTARARLLTQVTPEHDARAAPSVRERLRRIYEAELRDAWRQGDVATFDALLSVRALAPDGARAARHWRASRFALPVWARVRSAARSLR